MKWNFLFFPTILLLLAFSPPIRCQSIKDTILVNEFIASLRKLYLHEIGDNALIYRGVEYIRSGQPAAGSPFFISDSILTGDIYYKDMLYSVMSLRYDLVNRTVVIFSNTNDASISPDANKLDSFTIKDHFFLRLRAQNNNGLPVDDYYDRLYDGDPALFARREKKLVFTQGADEAAYIPVNSYYLLVAGTYHAVTSKNDLLDLMQDHKGEMKKFFRSNPPDFKKNPEPALLSSTIYYSHLKH